MNGNKKEAAYDSSLEECNSFYDNLPYERNMDICGNDCVRLFSGNVFKNTNCKESETRIIPNKDEVVLKRIKEQQKRIKQEEDVRESLSEEEL